MQQVTTIKSSVEDPSHLSMNKKISMLDSVRASKVIQSVAYQGEPIFSKKDLYDTYDILALLLRYLCIRENISMDLFEDRHRLMATQTFMSSNKRSYDFNNKKRSLMQKRVSWELIEKFCQIVGYDIIDVSMQLSNRETGEVFTVSKSDVTRCIKEKELPHVSILENEQAAEANKNADATVFRNESE